MAHRQPSHPGHCRFIHGHSVYVEVTLTADKLCKDLGFVYDFGHFKQFRALLEKELDHNLVLNIDDPLIGHLQDIPLDFLDTTLVPNCGAEGLAQRYFYTLQAMIDCEPDASKRNVRVTNCRFYEEADAYADFYSAN